MVAGLKVLDYLMDNASWLYALLEERGNRLRSITEDIFKAHGISAYVTGVGSLFMVHFVKEDVDPNDPAVLAQSRDLEREKLFHLLLMNRGVFVLHGGAISMAHDYEDLDRYFQSVSLAVKELQ
jgi:glutamate-1-semialdehyde 2,1-aminomutase